MSTPGFFRLVLGKILTYCEKLADWNARIAAHEAKIVECDAQQSVAQQATCEWRTYVLASQAEYDSCRERTLRAYADVLKGNKNMAEDYKAEWTAMKHLQCYMVTLRGNIEATGDALAHCGGLEVGRLLRRRSGDQPRVGEPPYAIHTGHGRGWWPIWVKTPGGFHCGVNRPTLCLCVDSSGKLKLWRRD